MRRLKTLISIFLILLLCAGCTKELAIIETVPTVPPTEITTEVPAEAPAKRKIAAEDIYWRSKLAVGDRAWEYSIDVNMNMRIGAAGIYMRTDMSSTSHIVMATDPCAVNITTDLYYTLMDMEVEQTLREYYRDEDGKLIYYYNLEQLDLSGREEIILEDFVPYAIIMDYTIWGYPYSLPQDLQVEEETQMLDGREVYMLTYTQNALDVFSMLSPQELDSRLAQIGIPTVWYVDTETFLPVEIVFSVEEVDALITEALIDYVGTSLQTNPEEEIDIEFNSFSCRYYAMGFEPVELEQVPEDVITGAKEAAGYAAL